MQSPHTEGAEAGFPRTTGFYRNPPLLAVLVDICERLHMRRNPVRVHVFAESTGEETWSLLFELIRRGIDNDVALEASDVDASCVLAARRAEYSSIAVSTIPPEVRDRFLYRRGERYFVRPLIRHRVKHRRIDVRLRAGQPGSVDLALFHNVLVHMTDEDQIGSLLSLRSAQAPGGYLSLGGVPIAGLRPYLEELGYRRFELCAQEIHEAWETQRKAWLAKTTPYWALPPFEPERALDFYTIYRLGDD
jgi:hypothetical protein